MTERIDRPAVATAPPAPETTVPEGHGAELLRELLKEAAFTRRFEDEENSIVGRLTGNEEALELFERRAQMLDKARMIAIRRTSPTDWILFKDKQGMTTAMLTASGAGPVAEIYGIQISNLRPIDGEGRFKPDRIDGDANAYSLRAWCDARSAMSGRSIQSLEGTRSSNEDFIGRSAISSTPATVKDSDLRASLYTHMLTKACRILGNMVRVPPEVLDQAWEGTKKKSADCRKGSGFGSSTERTAAAVTDAATKGSADELWADILKRVGGSDEDAKALLKEITANPEKSFAGFTQIARLTQGWQIERAWTNLRAHPTFGDQPEPGSRG